MAAVDLAAGQVSFLLIGRSQSCSIQSAHIAVSRAPWFCRTCPRRPADRAAVQRSSRRRHMQQRTLLRHRFLCRAMAAPTSAFDIPAAPILIPKGPWKEVDGCVCAPKGFKAQGMAGGLRAAGPKADIALVAADEPCVAAGVFTLNVMCAAPVTYCKQVLAKGQPVKAVLINAGQANAATGDQGYQDCLTSAKAVAEALGCQPEQVLLESTGLIDRCIKMHPVNQAVSGVIGRRIKMEALVDAVPKLASRLGSNVEDAHHAAVAITTTDLVSKSAALEVKIGGVPVRVGGFAKGSGMIHPNMATMLAIITTDASVDPGLWRTMLQHGTAKSFNQITVDGDTSTNDAVLGLASGAAGGKSIKHANSEEAQQLEAAVTALLQGLAKSVAWDGEGATCLMEVSTGGAPDDKAALTIAKSIAGSSLVKAAVFGHDPNWGRIACAAGYSGVKFNQNDMRVKLGDIVLMDKGQPLEFDKSAASGYLKTVTSKHGTVYIDVQVGSGGGHGTAWGCDLSYDYVKINAEYTT